ncbi:MAG TPA: Crp/Fnr family transcriptional regulator [Phycisphaerae bacterium]|nr:Crp/Fnr family transcriptional regulator [Phycisphaerae bacterium]
MPDLQSELSRFPLFAGLTPDELTQAASGCRTVTVRAEEMLFREGDKCEGFYLVLSGGVRVFKLAPDGRERILHIARAGQSFAEAAMFGPGVYPAFAAATEDSRLILVRREPFVQMLREQPETCLRVFESLSRWLRRLLDQLESETFLNARAKLANYLLRETRRLSPGGRACRIDLSQPKKDVASQLGMAAETFSRALSDLEARAMIRVSGRRIDVQDADALEALLLGEAGPNS